MTEMFDVDQDGNVDRMRYDSNGDQYNETLGYDQDENGRFEVLEVDTDGNGDVDMRMYDDYQDGRFERVAVDQDNNGEMEAQAFDTNNDNVLDTLVIDANFNGMDDREEAAADMIVGPVTNRDPISQLILDLAEETGQVVYGPSDSDSDGWYDHEDHRPHDPFYR